MAEENKPTTWNMSEARRGIARTDGEERDEHGFTPEMRKLAEALTHPDGDPYDNARRLGFYCEQCG